ncbi:MAG: DNA methyltransferase [Gammaproteobacteria bacterium]|nr:DNA methyltransferase [Gammaproteobacteria bacterium]MDE0284337.1 DNA methyltransferase [Gammaproteobacteria bacterium]MDE0512454.1 DNA methyltransferase [Gammaproteobacteria bacterium]
MNRAVYYESLIKVPSSAPPHWAASCTHQECSLHQLSPYIGKLKSIIAHDLILQYSKPGELVADMFCGSGTVPLEAARLERRVFASDTSIYAVTLTKGKLEAPSDTETALKALDHLLEHAKTLPVPDLRSVPKWVRAFFHPQTLKEVLRLSEFLNNEKHYFLLASLLGILHHQRPGFLSFPSSHLVPYLRSKKYPRANHPELYEYRPVTERLQAKVKRALKRPPTQSLNKFVDDISMSSVESVNLPDDIDCVITSPPYMNALDYSRDNRLRLWFLGETHLEAPDRVLASLDAFRRLISSLLKQLQQKMRLGGHCVFVIGEQTFRGGGRFPSEELTRIFLSPPSTFQLCDVVSDIIPDVRRSRKHFAGVKQENILVFRKF